MLAKNPAEFWNLSQAAAWVVFRSLEIVENFASPKEHGWQSFMKYPSSWPIPENCQDSDLFSKPIPNENKDKLEQRAAIFTRMQQNATTSLRTFQDAGSIPATSTILFLYQAVTWKDRRKRV